jgi:hypothetical protein
MCSEDMSKGAHMRLELFGVASIDILVASKCFGISPLSFGARKSNHLSAHSLGPIILREEEKEG